MNVTEEMENACVMMGAVIGGAPPAVLKMLSGGELTEEERKAARAWVLEPDSAVEERWRSMGRRVGEMMRKRQDEIVMQIMFGKKEPDIADVASRMLDNSVPCFFEVGDVVEVDQTAKRMNTFKQLGIRSGTRGVVVQTLVPELYCWLKFQN
jgi:hypothetical protein